MNAELTQMMGNADAIFAANNELQPLPQHDQRAVTSPQNGAKGGRPPIDNTAVAQAFQSHFDSLVRWWKGSFYEYSPKAGFWQLRTEKEMGARVAAFLNTKPVVGGVPINYSRNLEASIVGSLRGTKDLDLAPPCFLDDPDKDASGWAVMSNGLLDIEAAARGDPNALQSDFTPNFFSTRHFPFKWDPEAQCPRFTRFLEEVQPADDGRAMLWQLAGLLLVPDTSFNVFFLLVGDGGCGKSVFLNVMNAMLTDANVCSVTLDEMREKHTAHRLTQTLANLVDDSATVDGSKFGLSMAGAEGLLKRVTSGAKIHCEPKGVDPWEANATARCVFCLNGQLPQFTDRTEAIWDRLRVIPFPMRFRGTERQDPQLTKEIVAEELPGIFAWAVRGLGELRRHHKVFPQGAAGKELIDAHRLDCDRERSFLEERYEPESGATIPSGDVYTAYVRWCKDNGYTPKNAANFAAEVRRVFPGVTGPKKSRESDGQKWRYTNLARIEYLWMPSFQRDQTKAQQVPTAEAQFIAAVVNGKLGGSGGTDGTAPLSPSKQT